MGFLMLSCTNESLDENNRLNNEQNQKNFNQTLSDDNIVVEIYPYEICSASGEEMNYAVYATSSKVENFDRQVSFSIHKTASGSILKSPILTIPANSPSSISLRIFKSETSNVGNIIVTPTKVRVNAVDISANYNLISTNHDISNCLNSNTHSDPCTYDFDGDGVNNCNDHFPLDPFRWEWDQEN